MLAMTENDRISRLERLQQLRGAGAINEAEFASEKARIFGDTATHDRTSKSTAIILGASALIVGAAVTNGLLREQPIKVPVSVSTQPPVEATSFPPLSDQEALAAAFKAATGHAKAFTADGESGRETTTPVRILNMPFGQALLTSTEIADGCHACAGALGVYYLERTSTGYVVKRSWPKAMDGWGWGAPPTAWTLTEKFTTNPALYAEGGYTGQGITCGGASLVELRPEGPVSSDLINLSFSNAGNVDEATGRTYGGDPARDVEGKIADVQKDRSFAVRVAGKEQFNERYVWTGTKYKRMVKVSRLGC